MPSFKKFLRQSATLERKLADDDPTRPLWQDTAYEDPVTIRVRKTQKTKLHRDSTQSTLIPLTEILTEEPIKIGDLVDGEEIRGVDAKIDKRGKTIGYVAYPVPPLGFNATG